jgi:anaphase-promoting complex subunit 2
MDGSGDNDQLASHEFSGGSNVSAWDSKMDIDSQETVISESGNLVKSIGKVVRDLRCLGFTSMTEDSYSSAIIWLLKVHMSFCA